MSAMMGIVNIDWTLIGSAVAFALAVVLVLAVFAKDPRTKAGERRGRS